MSAACSLFPPAAWDLWLSYLLTLFSMSFADTELPPAGVRDTA